MITDKALEYGNKMIDAYLGLPNIGLNNYCKDWNLLMIVIEKIQKSNHLVSINFYSENNYPIECKIYNWGLGEPEQEAEGINAIETVWEAIIEHIKYLTPEPPAQLTDPTQD